MFGIHEGNISTEVEPFDGIKELGFDREGSKNRMDYIREIKHLFNGDVNRYGAKAIYQALNK